MRANPCSTRSPGCLRWCARDLAERLRHSSRPGRKHRETDRAPPCRIRARYALAHAVDDAASRLAMTTVVSVRFTRSMAFIMPIEVAGSTLRVGSSASKIMGRSTKAGPWRRAAARHRTARRHPVVLALEAHQVDHLGHDLAVTPGLADDLQREVNVLEEFRSGRSRKSWKTQLIRRRSIGTRQLDSRARSRPDTRMWPSVGRSSFRTSRRNVDLPYPEGPTRKTTPPLSTEMVTLSKAGPGSDRPW